MTGKENVLKFYTHEIGDHMPIFSEEIYTQMPLGFLERPDDGGDYDWFGVYYHRDATKSAVPTEDPKTGRRVLTDICQWREQVVFPDLESIDWEKAAQIDHVPQELREKKMYSLLIQAGLYERLHSLMGMPEALMAMVEEPEETKALIDAICDFKLKLFDKLITYYKPDVIRQHDDYGTQQNLQMSPAIWREMIKPNLKRMVDFCHQRGVRYEQHSCGKIDIIVPDLAQIGVDSWQGMHINDVPRLKQITGHKMTYHMSLNTPLYQSLDSAGKLTEEDLRRDVRNTVLASAVGGDYFVVNGVVFGEWWGTPVIMDEIEKCRAMITYGTRQWQPEENPNTQSSDYDWLLAEH